MIRSCALKPRQICVPAGVKQTIFTQFFSIFELGGETKDLMTSPAGNNESYFPCTLMFPPGQQNSLFPLGQSFWRAQ